MVRCLLLAAVIWRSPHQQSRGYFTAHPDRGPQALGVGFLDDDLSLGLDSPDF